MRGRVSDAIGGRRLLLGALLGVCGFGVPVAGAITVAGQGDARSECLVTTKVDDQEGDPTTIRRGSRIIRESCGDTCYFPIHLCTNTPLPGCRPATLVSLLVIGGNEEQPLKRPSFAAPLTQEACGATEPLTLTLRANRGKAVRRLGLIGRTANGRRTDADTLTLVCTRSQRPCCGDGLTQANEACDNGTRTDANGCDGDCTLTQCGDGHLTPPEKCDDGNLTKFDGCEPDCTITPAICDAVPAADRCLINTDCPDNQICSGCRCREQNPCTCTGAGGTVATRNLLHLVRTDAAGECGRVLDAAGQPTTTLQCSSLYVGGPQGLPPTPIAGSDSTVAVATCNGNELLLSGAAESEVPLNEGCSAPGCLYGGPIPVVTDLLTSCLVIRFASPASGSLSCDADWRLNALRMPLIAEVYRSGATLHPANPLDACPSNCGRKHDSCTYPPSLDKIASLDLPNVTLSTTAVALTAESLGTGDAAQDGVFCGFCRNLLDGFQGVSGAEPSGVTQSCDSQRACTDPNFPDCQQRLGGAFGSDAARRIEMTGVAAGDLSSGTARPATMVSTFCIPPSVTPPGQQSIDALSDLPGPGALGYRGTLQLTPLDAPAVQP